MTTETERRFVVDPDWALVLLSESPQLGVKQVQGYITADEKRTARVRLESDAVHVSPSNLCYQITRCFFTLKGKKDESGKGMEVEGEIPLKLATQLLTTSLGMVSKVRYILRKDKNLTLTLDVFHGANRGLVIMEVEGEDDAVKGYIPPSYAREVTNEHKYSCSQLAMRPYREWEEREKGL